MKNQIDKIITLIEAYCKKKLIFANPLLPFGTSVKEDPRLPFGVPKSDNGNYLWIQYFNSYLNEKGRAGFVMASSATDAGNTEKLIREQLIETENVDVIVSVGNNFFYTRSLPCHLWFLDKGETEANKDKILMIDARNTFRVVNTTINDFSKGQLLNLSSIVQLYRGNTNAITEAVQAHKAALTVQFDSVSQHYQTLEKELKQLAGDFKKVELVIAETIDYADFEKPTKAREIFNAFEIPARKALEQIKELETEIAKIAEQVAQKEIDKKTATAKMKPFKDQLNKLNKALKAYHTASAEYLKEIKQRIGDWEKLLEWFPDNKYVDVEGLCRIADLDEIKENDYSLTPGRYVGYSIKIDENFDYKARMTEIHNELAELNTEANDLMSQILSVKL